MIKFEELDEEIINFLKNDLSIKEDDFRLIDINKRNELIVRVTRLEFNTDAIMKFKRYLGIKFNGVYFSLKFSN